MENVVNCAFACGAGNWNPYINAIYTRVCACREFPARFARIHPIRDGVENQHMAVLTDYCIGGD